MTIAEKLQKVYENTSKVYEKGYLDGSGEGNLPTPTISIDGSTGIVTATVANGDKT